MGEIHSSLRMGSPLNSRADNIKEDLADIARIHDMDLDPGSHVYLALSFIYTWLQDRALPEVHGVMLDFGCGGRPYEKLFLPKLDRYIAADVAKAKATELDIELTPGGPVPMDDETVDVVLSTQCLEHVPDVDFYLSECSRLLRPGGVLILTAPMQWRHHEVPHDYLRFTRYGLTNLLNRHRFQIKDLSPAGGVFSLLGQIFLNHLAHRHYRGKHVFRAINRLALWLDKKYPDADDTMNWMCLAIKPQRFPQGLRL
jgi:SAM-dependent methyltransferase